MTVRQYNGQKKKHKGIKNGPQNTTEKIGEHITHLKPGISLGAHEMENSVCSTCGTCLQFTKCDQSINQSNKILNSK